MKIEIRSIKKETYLFTELNETKTPAYPKLWNTIKTIITGKITTFNAYITRLERSHIDNLMTHLKALQK